MNCHRCDTPLTGGLDTFGDLDTPKCLACWVRPVKVFEPKDPFEEWRQRKRQQRRHQLTLVKLDKWCAVVTESHQP